MSLEPISLLLLHQQGPASPAERTRRWRTGRGLDPRGTSCGVPPRFELFVLPQHFSWLGRWQGRLPRRLGKEAPRRWGAARSLFPNIAIALGTRLRVPFAIQKGCASYVLAFKRLSVRPPLREEWRREGAHLWKVVVAGHQLSKKTDRGCICQRSERTATNSSNGETDHVWKCLQCLDDWMIYWIFTLSHCRFEQFKKSVDPSWSCWGRLQRFNFEFFYRTGLWFFSLKLPGSLFSGSSSEGVVERSVGDLWGQPGWKHGWPVAKANMKNEQRWNSCNHSLMLLKEKTITVTVYHLESRWSNSHELVYHGPLLFATFWEVRHLLSLWCKMEKPMLVLLRFHHIPTGVFSRWVQAKSENPSWMGSQISQQSRRVWTCRPGWNPKRKGASSLKKPMCFRLQVLCCYATFNKTIAQPVESHPRISTCPLPAAQWSTVLPWWSTVCGSQPFSINPCLQFAIWRLGEAMIETKPHWNYVDMIFLF